MSSIENYEGLCGIIHLNSTSDQRVRCKYEFGHSGDHSWANKKVGLTIFAGAISPVEYWQCARYSVNTKGRKRVVIGH
jgi:hypothetical protein